MIHCLTVDAQVVDWLSQPNNFFNPPLTCMVADQKGNTYIGGHSSGYFIWGADTFQMQAKTGFIISLDNIGNSRWGLTLTPANNIDIIDIAVDSRGFIYALGEFAGNLTLNGTQVSNPNAIDGVIMKLDSMGNHVWEEYIRTPHQHVHVKSIAFDENDNFYVGGSFSDTVNFDTVSLVSNSQVITDGFVAKYDSSGACQWASSVFSTGPNAESEVLSVGARGAYVYAGGAWFGRGTFGSVIDSTTSTTPGHHDAFVCQLRSSDGAFRWTKFEHDTGVYQSFLVEADQSANVVLAHRGWFFDNHLLSYDSAGALRWTAPPPHGPKLWIADMTSDPLGSIYVVGDYDRGLMGKDAYYSKVTTVTGNSVGGMICTSTHPFGSVYWQHIAVHPQHVPIIAGTFSGGDYLQIGPPPFAYNVSKGEPYVFKLKDWPLGIEAEETSELNVFPNPANDIVSISGIPAHESRNVKLFDQAGRLVQDIISNGGEIQVSELPMGMYTITLVQNGVPMVGKIVVQH